MKVFTVAILLFLTLNVLGQDKKQLAPSPPMGWNSWNWFGKKEVNEQNMKECIDAIVNEGLRDAGYQYFVIDGGWRDTKLGPNGELLPNPDKFPNGMKALADYAHSRGLKFGLHTVPGTHDCGGDPVGGYGHEEVQIKQFVDWGLDFIKLDKCKYAGGWDESLLEETYMKWHNLLATCGRDIVLSISAYTWRDWYPKVGQLARTTLDIKARVTKGAVFDSKPLSVMALAEENNNSARFAGNGYWNDPDMLVMGNQGLTIEEQKVHFALWCIMSSPLILGNDPRIMTKEEKNIILNKDCIAINQDPTEQGRKIKDEGDVEIWIKHLENGKMAVLALNRNNSQMKKFELKLKEMGVYDNVMITNVYSRKKTRTLNGGVLHLEIMPHAGEFMLIEKE